jgi:hypothetical protein
MKRSPPMRAARETVRLKDRLLVNPAVTYPKRLAPAINMQ